MTDPTKSKEYQDLQLQLVEAVRTIRSLESQLGIKTQQLAELQRAAGALVDAEESGTSYDTREKLELIGDLRNLLDKLARGNNL